MTSEPHEPKSDVDLRMPMRSEPKEVRGYFVQVPLAQPDDGLNLRIVWGHIVRYRLMITLVVLIPVALATLVVMLMRPIYQADVLLVPAGSEETSSGLSALTSQFRGLASIAGISPPSSSTKEQTIAILKSRQFTQAFIESENLLPVLFDKQWDSASRKWKSSNEDDTPTMGDAVELFDGEVRFVNDDPSTNLVTLRIEWHDRELAARWANLLVDRLNEDIRHRDIEEAQRSIDFLTRELNKSENVDLRQGIYVLLQQQIEKIMLANVREDYAFKVLDSAVVPDPDQYVRPNRIAIIAAAGVLGLLLALLIVSLRVSWQPDS